MKKILFPTDFSEAANNAFIYALNVANKINASILTLHTYTLPDVGTALGFTLPSHLKEFYDSIDINEFETFKSALPALRKIADDNGFDQINIKHALESGVDAVTTILEVTERENVDFIVMGTKGAKGFKEIFGGTNAARVMEQANCPVLVVPSKANLNSSIGKIAVTTEFSKDEEKAFEKVLDFAHNLGASTECINVDLFHTHQYLDRMAILQKQFSDKKDLTFKVLEGNQLEPTIMKYLIDNEVDLLIMLTHKRSFIEDLFHYSITKKMAYHSSVPIMSIQAHSLAEN